MSTVICLSSYYQLCPSDYSKTFTEHAATKATANISDELAGALFACYHHSRFPVTKLYVKSSSLHPNKLSYFEHGEILEIHVG